MFKINLMYVALATALTSTVAFADPGSYTLSNGAKVIDIEKPNAAGVSHNMYRQFDVDNKGVIFNNNKENALHSTHGSITKNNNLDGTAATMILNEVVSNKASTLAGFIEVSGQKADVVIANPNGITCSGCSFINTNKAVLTTGKVALGENGAINSYTVTNGTITVDKKGMNASNSYAVLLADAIKINGTVDANNAFLSAGNFTLNEQTGEITSARKTANFWDKVNAKHSIDISELGGIRANSITMVGNNLGFGVRNKGAIVANSTLAMTSNGTLTNEGTITSNGRVTQLVSADTLHNTGSIDTKNVTLVRSLNTLVNQGKISSTQQLYAEAKNDLDNRGTLNGDAAVAVTTNGNLKTTYGSYITSQGQLNVNVAQNIDNGGGINGKNVTVQFGGSSMNVAGNISGHESLIVRSVSESGLGAGEIYNTGQILSLGNMLLQTNGTLAQESEARIEAQGLVATNSKWFKNNGVVKGAALQIANNKTDNAGTLTGQQVSLVTSEALNNSGTIHSANDMLLSTQNKGNILNNGTIQAGGTLTLVAKQIENGGYRCGWFNLQTCGVGTLSASKLILNSAHTYASTMGGKQQFKSTEVNTIR